MKLWDLLTHTETPPATTSPPKGVVVEVWLTRPDGEIYSRHCELLKFGGVISITNESGHRTQIRVFDENGKATQNVEGCENI